MGSHGFSIPASRFVQGTASIYAVIGRTLAEPPKGCQAQKRKPEKSPRAPILLACLPFYHEYPFYHSAPPQKAWQNCLAWYSFIVFSPSSVTGNILVVRFPVGCQIIEAQVLIWGMTLPMRGKQKTAGFTLIEIVFVISILCVLAGIAVFSYSSLSFSSNFNRLWAWPILDFTCKSLEGNDWKMDAYD